MRKRLIALSCLLAVSLVVAHAQEAAQAVPGATNFQRHDANFACGGAVTAESFPALKKLGFRTVINLRTASEPGANLEAEAKAASEAGVQYFNLPFSVSAPDPAVVDKFLELVKDSGNQPIYIHCHTGQRANAFWLIKRIMVDGWSTEKALAEADALKMTNPRLREFALAYVKDRKK